MRVRLAIPGLMILGLAALAACAAPPAKPAAGAASATQVARLGALPPQVAGFDRRAPTEVDSTPGVLSGGIARYLRAGAFATIYLFDRGQGPIPDGPGSPTVQAELRGTTDVATLLILTNIAASRPPQGAPASQPVAVNWQDMTLGARRGEDTAAALACAHAFISHAGRVAVELACVTGLAGNLLKIRVTASASPGQEAAALTALTNFAGQVRDTLAGGRTVRT